MKIQLETALFQVPFGSHLYGTNTPTSDYDYKIVCLPSFEDLLMNKKLTNRVKKPEGWREGDKMIAGEAEFEFIPLQVYFDQFFEGQTYAVELAFAVLNNMHTTLEYEHGELSIKDDSWRIQSWMSQLVSNFLTRNVQKMVGYAVSQSKQYGLKTERYNAYVKASELIVAVERDMAGWKGVSKSGSVSLNKVGDNPKLIEELCKLTHIHRDEIMNANGGKETAPAINIGGKQFPLTTTWKTVWLSIDSSIKSYGNRVKDHTGEPTDWKALSHATRIVEQIIELTTTGQITFPRPNAAYLLDMKQGKLTLEEATEYLADKFNKIDSSIESSVLKEKTPELEEEFYQFKLAVLKDYYQL